MSSKDKDPRNTPGTEADPSDAFLDALAERAAKDSVNNRANGGKILASIFDDPLVKSHLDAVPPPDDGAAHFSAPIISNSVYKRLIARNDALLRSRVMADNAYWARPAKAQRHLILKHQFSCAQDAHVALEVSTETKVIYVDVEHDPGRVPVSQIAEFIAFRLDLGGEEPYDDDTVKGSVESFSRRTTWRIVIRSGDALFHLVITKQLEKHWDYNLQLVPPCVP
jgi:hypothetical protein